MANSNLPVRPSLEHLKKLAKTHLQQLRLIDPDAQLATALLHVAREHGYPSWRALKAKLDERQPKKVANPVMRFLATADVDRSVAFYRDVLNFNVTQHQHGFEATLGPARIEVGNRAYPPNDYRFENPQPPGSTIAFLQSDDLEAMHTAMRARGASPSEVQKVNWIKMRMFEIRDPDGNVLWFGQSYHEGQDSPSRRDAQPHGIRQALPELPFDDVAAAVTYYRGILGFRVNYQQHDLGVMDRDAVTILLIARTNQHKGIGSFGTYVSDVDALYTELLAKKAHILGEPVSHPWGLRNFSILDLEGNRITFSQTFE
jgi:catechol 2,3-dioxygenase-like lactoylglutathione lyase family enzyme